MSKNTHHHFQLWGWILFVFSAIFFIGASLRAEDPVGFIGGALFLVACFVFLLPLLAEVKASASNSSRLHKYSRYLRDWFRAGNSQSRVPGARWTQPAPEYQLDQIQRHSIRSELRFFASTR